MAERQIPPVSLALIEELLSIYPNQVPRIDATEREVWASVGVQKVIAKLKQWYEQSSMGIIAGS